MYQIALVVVAALLSWAVMGWFHPGKQFRIAPVTFGLIALAMSRSVYAGGQPEGELLVPATALGLAAAAIALSGYLLWLRKRRVA